MAHAAEPAAAGADLRLQHRLDPLAQRQVGVAHDARGDARRPVGAAVAHRGNAGDEFRLADRTQFLRAGRAVHRVALQEHGRDHVVPAAQVREQFVQQVTMIRTLPQVMMGIDDRQFRVEDRFRRRLGQPCIIRWVDSPESGGLSGFWHGDASDIGWPTT